jgi:hypothetical protein
MFDTILEAQPIAAFPCPACVLRMSRAAFDAGRIDSAGGQFLPGSGN